MELILSQLIEFSLQFGLLITLDCERVFLHLQGLSLLLAALSKLRAAEIGIVSDLEALGVPKQDIVLGFHAPYKRNYTDYAVG